jgi:dihydroneopterin aldolase
VIVEIKALELYGRHGARPHEREHGQTFVFDVELEVGERGVSDRLEEAVDYSAVARCVKEVSDAHAYDLLEALVDAIASELLERFGPERVRVRARKPEVRPGGLDVEFVAVSVERP